MKASGASDTDGCENINRACACNAGDWFVLYQIGRNVNSRFFREFLEELGSAIGDGGLNNKRLKKPMESGGKLMEASV